MTDPATEFNAAATVSTVAADDWHATLRLTGEFDLASAGTLRDAVTAHLDAGRRVVHLDTTDVSFIDSTALGVIVALNARCKDAQGSLILTGVRGPVERLLEITGLDQVLLIDSAGDG